MPRRPARHPHPHRLAVEANARRVARRGPPPRSHVPAPPAGKQTAKAAPAPASPASTPQRRRRGRARPPNDTRVRPSARAPASRSKKHEPPARTPLSRPEVRHRDAYRGGTGWQVRNLAPSPSQHADAAPPAIRSRRDRRPPRGPSSHSRSPPPKQTREAPRAYSTAAQDAMTTARPPREEGHPLSTLETNRPRSKLQPAHPGPRRPPPASEEAPRPSRAWQARHEPRRRKWERVAARNP
jgi:hypothetical protein